MRDQLTTPLLKNRHAKHHGLLRVFVSLAPGAGKTYAMLAAAKERATNGERVLAACVDVHGYQETAMLLDCFEMLPGRRLVDSDSVREEFDLDNAIKRRPKLLLIDELAHKNLPGSRHTCRYQDVLELLAAGIDVYTTLNIQHLASLNDTILQITGVQIYETVPDQIIDHADELVLVDISPDRLIERITKGQAHLPGYIPSSQEPFFSPYNLTALRKLAVRELLKRVDTDLKILTTQDTDGKSSRDRNFDEKLLVLVNHRHDHGYLIRLGRQIADRSQIPWLVVWVDTGQPRYRNDTARRQAAFSLAKSLGAKTETLRGPNAYQTILPFIVEQHVTTVLLGPGKRSKLLPWRKNLYQKLVESGLAIKVSVFSNKSSSVQSNDATGPYLGFLGNKFGYVFTIFAVLLATVLAIPLEYWLSNANLVLLYVLAVVITGLKHGYAPAILASVLSFLSFNFFLTEPRYSFNVYRQDEFSTLLFLFLIALVSGPAASRIRRQFILLEEANRYSESMRLLGHELSVAEDANAVWDAVTKQLCTIFQADCAIVTAANAGFHSNDPQTTTALTASDQAAITWTQKHAEPSGRFTDTFTSSAWTIFPVRHDGNAIAAVSLRFQNQMSDLSSHDKELIATMLQQAADTWHRIQLVSELESARVKTEVEQLRSALLSSVSHDLKSPLAAMMGAADSMRLLDKQLSAEDRRELVDTVLSESRRLDSYIQNLLDMTRLGHGSLNIERDWVSLTDIAANAIIRLKRYFPSVKTEYEETTPPPLLYAHAALIEQALFNILENAAKFSPPEEKIKITVAVKNKSCLLTVKDRGPGIPEPLREKIFDMFYVVADGDCKSQGTGLGLAICRGMINAHGGTVTALPGSDRKGTVIVVELPIDIPAASGDGNPMLS